MHDGRIPLARGKNLYHWGHREILGKFLSEDLQFDRKVGAPQFSSVSPVVKISAAGRSLSNAAMVRSVFPNVDAG
jgi:hypothetical protein